MAVGGLVLAVGVLSLVRIAPESSVGGPGTAEAEPRTGPAATADRSTHTAATVGTVGTIPTGPPSAASAQGGVDGSPVPDAPARSATATPGRTPTTGTPPRADAPGATRPPTATASATPRPTPTPAPGRTSAAPAPVPAPAPSPTPTPDRPGGVCLPILGLCLDLSPAGGS
ncbi:hypothetical protein ACWEKM_32150 [Streptomyces sp. NPDC004752]